MPAVTDLGVHILHWEHFAHEDPSERHYAQRRGERGHKKQHRFRPVRQLGFDAEQSDHADEQVGQRADRGGPQHQRPFALPTHQNDCENVAEHAERRVNRLRGHQSALRLQRIKCVIIII